MIVDTEYRTAVTVAHKFGYIVHMVRLRSSELQYRLIIDGGRVSTTIRKHEPDNARSAR